MPIDLENPTDAPVTVTLTAEGPPGIKAAMEKSTVVLPPLKATTVKLNATIPDDSPPGFYHFFARLDAGERGLAYAWTVVAKQNLPKIDGNPWEVAVHPEVKYQPGATSYNFNWDLAVVYGNDASGWEVESAWLLYQTLEAATGHLTAIYQLNDLPQYLRDSGHLIIVGTPKSNPLVGDAPSGAKAWVTRPRDERLVVGGIDEQNLNLAAIDLALRYWKHAKDSGCRRIPLTDKPMSKGADPGALP
jgi:hypothetical protein